MNTNWISIILVLLFVVYFTSLFVVSPIAKLGSGSSTILSTSEQYIPTTAFVSNSSGLLASMDLNNIYIPPKTIIMFSGQSIPSGWVECNGYNGTPDLRGRIPLAFNNSQNSLANKIGNTGGQYDVSLLESELPTHTHTGKTTEGGYGLTDWGTVCGATTSIADNRDNHIHILNIDYTGNSDPHNNMPPYYAVRFIMKT